MGFEAHKLSGGGNGRNDTGHGGKRSDKDGVNAGALIAVIGQLITIITAIILIVVAALHRAKLRKLLLIWLGWAVIGVVVIIIALIIRLVVYKTHFIDIFITLVFCAYIIICFWFVLSYYKFLDPMGDHPGVNYDASGKDGDFLAVEKQPEPGD